MYALLDNLSSKIRTRHSLITDSDTLISLRPVPSPDTSNPEMQKHCFYKSGPDSLQ